MKEKYIQKIVKRLNCSGKRKKEIRKQLTADIEEALTEGDAIEEIIARMGEPQEIADSFNQSFPEEEKKKYRKERRLRRVLEILLVIIVLAAALWWMIPKNTWLKDSRIFDEATVQEKAEEVVQLLDADDYDGLRAMAVSELAEVINEEEMEQARANLAEDWGDFVSCGTVYLIETTQRGQHSAVAQMSVSYENTSVTYTISFNEEMQLNGLWMK